jgi:ribosome biogenesis protein MAK21
VKRLLQVSMHHFPPFICGALYLVSEVIKVQPNIRFLITDPEASENDEEKFMDAAEDAPADGGMIKIDGNGNAITKKGPSKAAATASDDDGFEEVKESRDESFVGVQEKTDQLAADADKDVHTSVKSEDGKSKAKKPAGSLATGRSRSGYDPLNRNPEFAEAKNSCLWELVRTLSITVSMVSRFILINNCLFDRQNYHFISIHQWPNLLLIY